MRGGLFICMLQCMSFFLAPNRPLAMSTFWSLTGGKRTSHLRPPKSENDPQETSPALSEPDIMALITPVLQGSIRSHQPVAVSTCRANLSRVW